MRDAFPFLESSPKAEGHRQPSGETSFARECRKALRNLPGFSDFSRPRKELYREGVSGGFRFGSSCRAARLVAGRGSLLMELGARFRLLEQFRVLAHLAACPGCVAPCRLDFQSGLGRQA